MIVLTAVPKRYPGARGVPLALVAALALAAAVVGLLGGGAFQSGPAPVAKPSTELFTAGSLRVQAPEGWSRSGTAALAGFTHALWLRDDAAKIDAALELRPAVSPTLLPAGVRPVGAPSVQQLGAHAAWRYRTETSTGTPAIFFVAPTTNGIATVACVGAVAGTPERACRALASGVAVSGAQRLELGQGAAFLSALPAVVRELNTARDGGHRALTAATSHTAQASAASDLARSYRSAAAALAPLTDGKGEPRAAVDALETTASAYTELAGAARSRSPQAYAQAGAAVAGAERLLGQATTKVAAAMRTSSAAARRTPAARPSSTPVARPSSTPAARPSSTPAARPSSTPATKRATRKATKTPVSTPISTPHAATRPVPAESGGGSMLPFLLLLGALVIVVGFGLEIRSMFKEQPGDA